ncbi:MAG: HAD-IA family hydrolase [Deltaproteobacteria bacterium]|nr:HAD-IA family hydrolase [Deltaproteobacteria bacterium]
MLDHPQPKVLLLDLGGVVFDVQWTQMIKHLGLSEKFTDFQYWKIYDRFERGDIDLAAFQAGFEERVEKKFNPHAFQEAFNYIVHKPLDGIEKIISAVVANKIPLYALSNISITHADYVQTLPVMKPFIKIFKSYELRSRKPEVEIYERMLAELPKYQPHDFLFIDDREANLETARKLGFHGEQSVDNASTLESILKNYGFLS